MWSECSTLPSKMSQDVPTAAALRTSLKLHEPKTTAPNVLQLQKAENGAKLQSVHVIQLLAKPASLGPRSVSGPLYQGLRVLGSLWLCMALSRSPCFELVPPTFAR